MESVLEEIAVELLEDSFAGFGDGDTPEGGFPVIMERCAWRESHGGAGAPSENDGRFFGFPAVDTTVRALVF